MNFNTIYKELSDINEATTRTWYSGYARGLNDISTRVTPQELEHEAERKAKEEEERRLEYERQAPEREQKALEHNKQFAEREARRAIAANKIIQYNCREQYHIRQYDYWPAVDPDTKELVYDADAKEKILQVSHELLSTQRSTASKKAHADRKKRLENEYTWTASYTLWGDQYTITEKIQGNDDPEGACELVKQKALAQLKKEKQLCRELNMLSRFQWDGKLLVTVAEPYSKGQIYKQFKFKVN